MEDTLFAGETILGELAIQPLSFQFDDYTSVAFSSCAVYKNGTGNDIASTVMPTGSNTASGNILTIKPLQGLVGGNFYVISLSVTVNGTTQTEHRYFRVWCPYRKSGLVRNR